MKLIDRHARLLAMDQPVFRTRDAAGWLPVDPSLASKILARLAESGHVIRLARAVWALRDKSESLAIPEYLTAPFPCYISLHSALYYHGAISQIPAVTYAVSPARTRRFHTPLGTISVHHLHPAFFFGYEAIGPRAIKMATPEKALLDLLYLSPTKTSLFRDVPELELPRRFSLRRAREMIRAIPSTRRRTLVTRRFNRLMREVHA